MSDGQCHLWTDKALKTSGSGPFMPFRAVPSYDQHGCFKLFWNARGQVLELAQASKDSLVFGPQANLKVDLTHTHTHPPTHARTHARMHAHAHALTNFRAGHPNSSAKFT